MSTETVTHPLPEGTIARIGRQMTSEEESWSHFPRHAVGRFTLDEFVRAADNPDPQPDDIQVDFYEATDEHGCTVVVPADVVTVVMTAAEASARTLPSPETLLAQLDLLGSFEDFETDESDRDGEFSREVYGRTHEGLTFGFRLTVAQVWRTDS